MIDATKTGPGTVAADGIEVKHRTPTLALCRALIAAGHPDVPLTLRDLDGRVLLTVPSIAAAAELTVEESSGCRFGRWEPFPRKSDLP